MNCRKLRKYEICPNVCSVEFSIHQNSGQHCQANSRVFVEASIADQFLQKLTSIMQSRKLGDPLDKTTFQGPQGDKLQQERVLALIEDGKRNGELVVGGKGTTVNGKVRIPSRSP